ncbi:hypothetical protein DRF60_15005 [Chryseobacterium elymi]|uniref:Uncharacterized protein n=1 Tax=Chryseobacterium elymi TaxID=395936 RepID=A0A3D9DCR5_9FLAO|nr:hypothetical protein [Chryseobacterium elymi]REC75817.1 hypothetical protein DRF60_15005 [Chryseobacterium elymi]
MYKKLENYSINHEGEVNFHEFNKRILRTIESLSITEIVSNSYLYEVDQKTNKGIRISYYPKKIEISIFPSSSKYDYKLADILVNYLAFYSNGFLLNTSPKSKFSLPYDDRMKNDNRGYFIIPKVSENITTKILKG